MKPLIEKNSSLSRRRWIAAALILLVYVFVFPKNSEALHVVERWKFLDANTIEYKATINDEKVFSRAWDISVILHRHREKNFQLVEDYRFTLDYDQSYPYPCYYPANECASKEVGALIGKATL